MGQTGRLPGAFFGRVCNIAQVVGMDSAAAANAVAKETIDLVTFCFAHNVCPVDGRSHTSLSIFCAAAYHLWAKENIVALSPVGAFITRLTMTQWLGAVRALERVAYASHGKALSELGYQAEQGMQMSQKPSSQMTYVPDLQP